MKTLWHRLCLLIGVGLLTLLPVHTVQAAFDISVTTDPNPLVQGQAQTVTIETGASFQVFCTFGITINGPGRGSASVSLTAGTYQINCSDASGTEVSNTVTITVNPAPANPVDPGNNNNTGDNNNNSGTNTTNPDIVAAPPGLTVCHPTTPIRIRANPSTDSEIRGEMPAGTEFSVNGQNPAGTWYNVTINGVTGWVSASAIFTNQVPNCGAGLDPVAPLDLTLCPNGEELTIWAENLPGITQGWLASYGDVCGAAQEYYNEGIEAPVQITGDAFGFMAENCPINAISLLYQMEERDPTERLETNRELAVAFASDDPMGALCERPLPTLIEDQLVNECNLTAEDRASVEFGLGQVGATLSDLDGPRGCRLFQLLRLLGGKLSEPQVKVYNTLHTSTCNKDIINALEDLIWLVANGRLPEILALIEAGEFTLANCDLSAPYTPPAFADTLGSLPQNVRDGFATCSPELLRLLINVLQQKYVNGLNDPEANQILNQLIDVPEPCVYLVEYLARLAVPTQISEARREEINNSVIPPNPDQPTFEGGLAPIVNFPDQDVTLVAFTSRGSDDPQPIQGEVIRNGSPDVVEREVPLVLYPALSLDAESIAYLAGDGDNLVVRGGEIGNTMQIMFDLNLVENVDLNGWEIVPTRIAWAPNNSDLLVTLQNANGEVGIYLIAPPNRIIDASPELEGLDPLVIGRSPFISPVVSQEEDPRYFMTYELPERDILQMVRFNDPVALVIEDRENFGNSGVERGQCSNPSISAKAFFVFFECLDGDTRTFYAFSMKDGTSAPLDFEGLPDDVALDTLINMAAGPVEGWLAFDDSEEVHLVQLENGLVVDYQVALAFPPKRLSSVYWRNPNAVAVAESTADTQ
ncbi:MAG: hypothetical protein OHK0046_51490 [Anaerolineae bacterium]